MSTLILLLVVAGCIAYQYFKGSLVKAAVSIITVLSSGIIAFAFFEQAAAFSASKFGEGSYSAILPWLNMICFIILFVASFAILQTVAVKLILKTIEFDELVSRIGRCVCAAVYGWMLTGFILTALIISPLPKSLPYSRVKSINPVRMSKAILSPDDAVSGIFSLISRGSMAGKKSFSVVHPSFINEFYMSRLAGNNVSRRPISVFGKEDIRKITNSLKDQEGIEITSSDKHELIAVKVDVSKELNFTLSQVRLVCNYKVNSGTPFKGKGINIYPIGYLNPQGQLQTKRLDDVIEIHHNTPKFDFVFDMPEDCFPVWLGFKQNNLLRLPRISSPSDAQPASSN